MTQNGAADQACVGGDGAAVAGVVSGGTGIRAGGGDRDVAVTGSGGARVIAVGGDLEAAVWAAADIGVNIYIGNPSRGAERAVADIGVSCGLSFHLGARSSGVDRAVGDTVSLGDGIAAAGGFVDAAVTGSVGVGVGVVCGDGVAAGVAGVFVIWAEASVPLAVASSLAVVPEYSFIWAEAPLPLATASSLVPLESATALAPWELLLLPSPTAAETSLLPLAVASSLVPLETRPHRRHGTAPASVPMAAETSLLADLAVASVPAVPP